MIHQIIPRRLLALLLVAVAISFVAPTAVRAADPLPDNSLAFVPADVSFYYSMQRNREVYQRVTQSKAYAKLQESGILQMGMFLLQNEMQDPESDLAPFWEEMRKPENIELKDLALDMASREMFIYGDHNWAEVTRVYNEIYREAYGEIFRALDAESVREDADLSEEKQAEMAEKLVRKVIDSVEQLEFPTLVVGFRLSDTERAKRQLDRLDKLARELEFPSEVEFEEFRRQQLGQGDYLTIKFKGIKIPEAENDAEIPDEIEAELKAMFENMEFEAAIGIHGDYALISIGPNNEHLAQLGEGELLINRPELATVRQAVDRPLTSVSFSSKDMVEQSLYSPETIDLFVEFGYAVTRMGGENLSPKLKQQLDKGLESIGEGIKKWFPERGARMSYSWLTDSGFEGYRYNWDENIGYNGREPLSVLNHLGGDPLFFWLTRHEYRPDSWDPLIEAGYLLMDSIALAVDEELEEEGAEEFLAAWETFRPLVKRAEKIYRQEYQPALAEGQRAWVLDAKLAKRSWHTAMPPADEPLAIPEFGSVYGVSDLAKLEKAHAQYKQLGSDMLKQMAKLAAEDAGVDQQAVIQEMLAALSFELEERQTKVGKLLVFPFPAEAGVPEELAITYGYSEKLATSTYSPDHAIRLLTPTPLAIDGPIAEHEGPAFDAFYFNWHAMLDKTVPWIEYAAKLAAAEEAEEEAQIGQEVEVEIEFDQKNFQDEPFPEFDPTPALLPELDQATLEQIRSTIDYLKVFQQYSSISYLEDDAQVTHYEWRFQDLP